MSFLTRGATYSRIGIGGALIALSVTMFAGTATAATGGTAAPQTAPKTASTHAAHVTGAVGPARGKHLTHRAVTPHTLGGTASSSTADSANWDGYTVLNSSNSNTNSFNSVSATWTVPAITCDGNPSHTEWTADWVGLDGWLNDSVEQGGSEEACFNNVPTYNVWWEMFPFNDIQTSFSVNPGDVINANVTFVPSTADFDISVKDVTLNQTLTEDIACQADQAGCARSSAEVISEDTGGGTDQDGEFLLPNYGTINYSQASVTSVSGHTGSLNDPAWNNVAITEVSSAGITKQTVGPLSTDGTSFSTAWKAESGAPATASLVAEYLTNNTSATTNQLSPQIELVNTGSTAVQLNSVTVRYWFTEDGTGTLNYSCDFAVIGCTSVGSSFVTVSPAVTGADHYVQFSFANSQLGPNGGSTGTIEGRIFQSSFANMTQTNDYSFNAADTSFTPNPHITVYFNGNLIYGTEP